jgi:O-phosphoseryl-tRNA(Cys) synthetase
MSLALINRYLTIGFELVINFLIIQKHSAFNDIAFEALLSKGRCFGCGAAI